MMQLLNQIFESASEDFDALAIEVFNYQYNHCLVYKQFVDLLNKPNPCTLKEIPFLPIELFKSHQIISKGMTPELIFKSSGTSSQQRSSHFVADSEIYKRSFITAYRQLLGNPEGQVILALLPSYLDQGESSLVYMVNELIQLSNSPLSGFYKDQHHELIEKIELARANGKQAVLFGVSYALLDLAELKPDLHDVMIIETGGMKGRRKELTKEELHDILSKAFNTVICSEYGMTELLSQGYSRRDGLFDLPPWLRVIIRDTNDPFHYLEDGKTGGINVIDLANIFSCSFISTQDLGQWQNNQLRLMGRFDTADIRGCNLLIAD